MGEFSAGGPSAASAVVAFCVECRKVEERKVVAGFSATTFVLGSITV